MKDRETDEYIYRNGWYRDKKTGRISSEYPYEPFITKDNWPWVFRDIYIYILVPLWVIFVLIMTLNGII